MEKADRFLGAIRCLLPNVNRPKDAVRRLYYCVWESVVLYGAPLWTTSLTREEDRKIVRRAQRAALIRTSTAYRMVAHGALCVITGTMPIHIKAWLRWRQYEVKKMYNQNPEEAASIWMEEMKVLETQVQVKWGLE